VAKRPFNAQIIPFGAYLFSNYSFGTYYSQIIPGIICQGLEGRGEGRREGGVRT